MPGSWGNSEASSAWTEGVTLNVCGWANSLDRGRTEAILWSREVSGCAFRVPNGCAADFDHDADFDSDDISGFFAAFEAGSICGDADFDGDTDSDDVIEFFGSLSPEPVCRHEQSITSGSPPLVLRDRSVSGTMQKKVSGSCGTHHSGPVTRGVPQKMSRLRVGRSFSETG